MRFYYQVFSLDFYFSSDTMKVMSEDLMTAPETNFLNMIVNSNDNLSNFGVDQLHPFIPI